MPYRHTVLEPVGRFCSYFQNINGAIEKRNKKVRRFFPLISRRTTLTFCSGSVGWQLLDYDSARSRMRKLAEKGAEDVTKLPRVRRLPSAILLHPSRR